MSIYNYVALNIVASRFDPNQLDSNRSTLMCMIIVVRGCRLSKQWGEVSPGFRYIHVNCYLNFWKFFFVAWKIHMHNARIECCLDKESVIWWTGCCKLVKDVTMPISTYSLCYNHDSSPCMSGVSICMNKEGQAETEFHRSRKKKTFYCYRKWYKKLYVFSFVIDTHLQIPVSFLPLVRQSFWGQHEQVFKTHKVILRNTLLLKQPTWATFSGLQRVLQSHCYELSWSHCVC